MTLYFTNRCHPPITKLMVKKSEIQIFLAHAQEDKEEVLKLYERLKKAGYKPWLDKKDLIPGQNWRSVIPRVIKESQLFIACLSERSISKRGYVQNEFKIALNQLASFPSDSIYFIPLRLDECEIPDLRQDEYGLNLRDLHWLDYWEDDGFEQLERAISYQCDSFTQEPYIPDNTELVDKVAESLERVELKTSQFQSFIENLGNGVELEMIAIPGGEFMMGSPEGEGRDNEKPQHEVTVQAFYMSKYPITQAQYQGVMGKNPSNFKGDERPVEKVTWFDAVKFCQKLSEKKGKEYRLPTEAEWEYACRAETTTPYHFGDTITDKLANFGKNIGETNSVGQFTPNSFGLYYMHGNVWEWCEDDWHENYEDAPTDGSAWLSEESNNKVMRGGSWKDNPGLCRSAYRVLYNRFLRGNDIGFRVVCVAPRTT